ncbi:hypothetical protein N7474_001456 [Penicillium riverlandense]|uniref:uncharacterized protein n=1 Tax=Penicillium riverlandense TaxID=1903569 RepID=UPI0025475727|nr:uncharacterized protein N7474_001456 [Penicillium riverlandense]KAJ5833145.1 hypothetical protein N7474_001456 [Penicillium riverlandense]
MEVLKELHASVAEACEVSFDNAYRHLNSSLARYEERVRDAEHNASMASQAQKTAEDRIQALQHEISVLQTELKRYEVDPKDLELPQKFSNLEDEFSPKHVWESHVDHAHPEAERPPKGVEAKYTALYDNLQTFIQTWSGLKARVLQHKKKLRYWDRQLERDEFTLVRNGLPVTFRKVASGVDKHKHKTPVSSRKRSRSKSHEVSEAPSGDSNALPNQNSAADRNSNIKTEQQSQNLLRSESPGLPSTQTSSPRRDLTSSEPGSFESQDTLPSVPLQKRKRMPWETPSNNNTLSHSHPRGDVSDQPVLIKSEPVSSSPVRQPSQSLGQLPSSTQDLDEIGITIPTPTKRKAESTHIYTEDAQASHDDSDLTQPCPQRIWPDEQLPQPSVLQPVDGNARTFNVSEPGSNTKRRKQVDMDLRAISGLAEDGDRDDWEMGPPNAKVSSKISRRRLHDLLEGSLPSKSPLRPPNTTTVTVQDGTDGRSTPPRTRVPCRTSARGSILPQSERKTATRTSPDDLPPEIRPEDEPFRALPLDRLTLNHFKINSARNQGADYAYDEVVRKKDDRKCLPGCTRPGCCGDHFRGLARLGGLPTHSTEANQEEEQRILEEYMGDDQHLIHGLSRQDREKLLVEARARLMANQYGRHRHTYQRAPTPPGFWRTEMPDSQEEEWDRKAARRLEREKVEERYREAMRPGGLWQWADE